MEKKRIIWVDVAKAIGFFLVVMGHTDGSRLENLMVYSFHMPLFFFLSGYTYSFRTETMIKKFTKSAKKYLSPYILASVVTILLVGGLGTWYYDFRSHLSFDNILDKISSMAYETVMGYGTGMLWFLSAMFCTKLAMDCLAGILTKGNRPIITLAALIFLAPLSSKTGVLPWNIDVLPICFFFCFLGYWFKEKQFTFCIRPALICTVLWAILVSQGISLNINERWISGLSMINACFAIYALITFTKQIPYERMRMRLDFLGENSLYLFIIHHLERMEIPYIWNRMAECLSDNFGIFSYWIVLFIRCGCIVICFGILHIIFKLVLIPSTKK